MNDTKVLITGGAGFIGTSLARALAPSVGEVVLLDSLHPDVHGDDPDVPEIAGTAFVRGDVTSMETWQHVLDEFTPDAIVHLAAETGTGISLSQATRHAHVNVVGTTTMLDALWQLPRRPRHLILTSSRAVYGEGRWSCAGSTYYGQARTPEDLRNEHWTPRGGPPGPSEPLASSAGVTEPRPTNVYAATKLAQEQILSAWSTATATALSMLRLQNVYGPGQSLVNPYTGVLALFARLAVSGGRIEVYEDGGAIRDFVYIEDVVQALLGVLANPPERIRLLDIGSGMATTLAEVAETMSVRESAPRPFVSGRFREGDVRAALCDISAAAAEIGYAPSRTLEAGLGELLDWVRNQRATHSDGHGTQASR